MRSLRRSVSDFQSDSSLTTRASISQYLASEQIHEPSLCTSAHLTSRRSLEEVFVEGPDLIALLHIEACSPLDQRTARPLPGAPPHLSADLSFKLAALSSGVTLLLAAMSRCVHGLSYRCVTMQEAIIASELVVPFIKLLRQARYRRRAPEPGHGHGRVRGAASERWRAASSSRGMIVLVGQVVPDSEEQGDWYLRRIGRVVLLSEEQGE
eukprot:768822-Hanusia_phi.AAC.8